MFLLNIQHVVEYKQFVDSFFVRNFFSKELFFQRILTNKIVIFLNSRLSFEIFETDMKNTIFLKQNKK